MILHIPHASREIPAGLRDQIVLTDDELASKLLAMTDAFTDHLFTCRGATRVVFPVSRLVVDPERLRDDGEETMFQICVGTDPFHTPESLKQATIEAIRRQGFRVEENRPYAGTLVPAAYYRIDRRVWSIMIEVCRDLYMDEKSGSMNENFFRLHLEVEELLKNLLHAAAGKPGWGEF
ncbi:MAG: N-formylglutamate amidohydrolase [Thermodesulfobacteriota bacterium]